MSVIEKFEDRDDVVKTEYKIYDIDRGEVDVEMWHDTKGMKRVFDKSLNEPTSEKALREFAKEQALAVRETRIDVPPK